MAGKSRLAIEGGPRHNDCAAPAWPIVGDLDLERMADTVRSGRWSWIGEHEQAFCREYADFIGTRYCVCMANGTVTLQCALQALGIVPGDEVVVPALTWVATAQAAMDIGANVVLADIDPETYCLDPVKLEEAVTKRTKAVIPVHLYGCMCDMDAIMAIATTYNLKVVEDVAHQQGSQWRGKCAGSLGDAGSYSFQQSKILTSGEGGALTCNDPEVYRAAFALKQVGWAPEDPLQSPFGPLVPGNRYGHNYRMTEMQAVLLRGGLSRLQEQNERREKNAATITRELKRLAGPLRAAARDPRISRQAYYAMTLHYDKDKAGGIDRSSFLQALSAEGVHMGGPYHPVYRSPLLNLYDSTSPIPFREKESIQSYSELSLPVTEKVVAEEGVLISHQHLLGDAEYLEKFIGGIEKVCANLDALEDFIKRKPAQAKLP